MIAFDIMLAALAQAAIAAPPQPGSATPVPNVTVVGPTRHNRIVCSTIIPSGSHIAARRICRTFVQDEEARDRAQQEAEADVESAIRRTNEMLYRSDKWHPGPGESHLPN